MKYVWEEQDIKAGKYFSRAGSTFLFVEQDDYKGLFCCVNWARYSAGPPTSKKELVRQLNALGDCLPTSKG